MADKSGIEWTDATWNPFTGCTKVSPGCDNCYMFRQYPRLKAMGVNGYSTGPDAPQWIDSRFGQPQRWTKPRMVFVNSMSDTFHSEFEDEHIAAVFDSMLAAPQHTYQVLTKRPNRVRRWWERYRRERGVGAHPDRLERACSCGAAAAVGDGALHFESCSALKLRWPANIWLGTSVESAKYLPRIERIAGIAPVTFLSAEPLLGPIAFDNGDPAMLERFYNREPLLGDYLKAGHLQWVIVGGESGPNARPMEERWAQQIWAECHMSGVPFFFKQWGGATPKSNGRELLGRTFDEMPVAVS